MTKKILLLLGLSLLCSCSARYTATTNESSLTQIIPQEPIVQVTKVEPIEEVKLNLQKGLGFLHPEKDTTVPGTEYYLTGTSDPTQTLLLDGEEINDRGKNGSFACFRTLVPGANEFQLQQGEKTVSVTVTNGAKDTEAIITDTVTKMEPQDDIAVECGTVFTLQCVAPSGATVSAKLGTETIQLKQNKATAVPKVPATFSATYKMPISNGTEKLGVITYLMDGKEFTSTGILFATQKDAKFLVKIKNVSSCVFTSASVNSPVLTTGKIGAIDEVTEISRDASGGEMYHLKMGGWIQTAAASPLESNTEIDNKISDITFAKNDTHEVFTLHGTTNPFYKAEQNENTLTIRFYHSSGAKPIKLDSEMFSEVEISQDAQDLVMTFQLKEEKSLWGYLVEYNSGETTLTCLPRPKLSRGELPFDGITIAIDAGHGGTDTGTLGLPYTASPMEKDVTIVTAQELEKELLALGAKVVMVRRGDENPSMNERMAKSREEWADFYISLHANSGGFTPELIKANGLEVYYFEPKDELFATQIADNICISTGRTKRGVHQSNYRVTMQSFAPSILVELGFMPNPKDFDSLCDPEEISNTSNAITSSIKAFLEEV